MRAGQLSREGINVVAAVGGGALSRQCLVFGVSQSTCQEVGEGDRDGRVAAGVAAMKGFLSLHVPLW